MARPAAALVMRRKFRALFDADPEAFALVVADLQRAGAHWRKQLPPIERGSVGRQTLAILLADYRVREIVAGRKVKRQTWLEEQAALGIRHGTAYSEGVWRNLETIKSHLKDAVNLAKTDPEFAREVQAMADIIVEIGGLRSQR